MKTVKMEYQLLPNLLLGMLQVRTNGNPLELFLTSAEIDTRQGDPQLYSVPAGGTNERWLPQNLPVINSSGGPLLYPQNRPPLVELGSAAEPYPATHDMSNRPLRVLSEMESTQPAATIHRPRLSVSKMESALPQTASRSSHSFPNDPVAPLPRLRATGSSKSFRPREGVGGTFSIERVAWALQSRQLSNSKLQEYLAYIENDVISEDINKEIEGAPAIFYAVETNNEEIVQTLIDHGGDVNARRVSSCQPLLAFSILLAEQLQVDTTGVVVILLASGADALVIPQELYTPFLQEKSAAEQRLNDEAASPESNWCTEEARRSLATSLNITQRYNLHKNVTRKKPSIRLRHAVGPTQLNISPLFGLPYRIVGQEIAVKQLTDQLLGYLAMTSQKPLVLFFSGPSGHGKSELSKLLGSLLSFPWLSFNMSKMRSVSDLFGPEAPFCGYEKGSRLNNFISHNSGKRVIAFLDEFEKSSHDVRDALLLPFDEGI